MNIPAPLSSPSHKAFRAALLAIGAAGSLTPFASPAIALGAGAALALVVGNPWPTLTNLFGTRLLQASVVGLGFGIPLGSLASGGSSGLIYTVALLAAVFAAGTILARAMGVDRELSVLIAAGTGICGGSAIAALGPAIGAKREAMGIALATVFILNGVALYLFPPVGHLAGLSEHQFGIWAALAIHDTSSVVGAAATYGPLALHEATILKLARALWIIPLVLVVPAMLHSRRSAEGRARTPIPWFIGLFVLASVLRAIVPGGAIEWFDMISRSARTALVLTLFLIGAGLAREQLRAVGARPLAYGVLLWVIVAGSTLAVARWGIAP